MILNEIFYSIQGEGVNVGAPAIFVRFGNCNLKCRWCDTKYTWHPDVRDNHEEQTSDIIKKIKQWPQCRHLVITGGEPMLQQDVIIDIRRALPDYYIEVETNGSQEPKSEIETAINLFTVSYKTSNSGNVPYELKMRCGKCVYKFVVCNAGDFAEIEGIIAQYNLPAEKIFLMPEGTTAKAISAKSDLIIEYCRNHGYRFSPRLHVLLWGAKRGV